MKTDTVQQSAPTILVVDDDHAFQLATKTFLQDEGLNVALAGGGEEALSYLRSHNADLLLSDMVMGDVSGIDLLKTVKSEWPDLPVIMVTGFGSIKTAVEAMRFGADDYLTKPANNQELLIKIQRTLASRSRDRELARLRDEITHTYRFANISSRSEMMRQVFDLIKRVVDTDVTVLIRGESGTGKELVARALHFNSLRRDKPFVVVNTSAIPENLLESEIFGHEKGAFTGAVRQRAGRFEEARGGTLFLDEIGDIAPSVQSKLLRVLEEKTFERVGGNSAIHVDTRVVAATNRNLEMMMRDGDFREDLFYRLNVFPIHLPPLRERLEDLPLLAELLLERHADLAGRRVTQISPDVLTAMMNYSWRGNVRELENLLKRAIIKTTGDTITAIDLPTEAPAGPQQDEHRLPADVNTPLREYLSTIIRDAEKRYLVRVLKHNKGNINQISKLLEVDRKTVYRKLSDYGLDPSTFRN